MKYILLKKNEITHLWPCTVVLTWCTYIERSLGGGNLMKRMCIDINMKILDISVKWSLEVSFPQ